jgi:hypothetical protein
MDHSKPNFGVETDRVFAVESQIFNVLPLLRDPSGCERGNSANEHSREIA